MSICVCMLRFHLSDADFRFPLDSSLQPSTRRSSTLPFRICELRPYSSRRIWTSSARNSKSFARRELELLHLH